nr:MAG TPA: hypothetical protein [Caudoviricetes sp.]
MYELWCELTYLWHRVKPNLAVRSVPLPDILSRRLKRTLSGHIAREQG